MAGVCDICGSNGADALCIKCGRVVCERCFHGAGELCVECAPKLTIKAKSSGVSSSGLRAFGIAFVAMGLLVTSMAFVTGGREGVIVMFPFVFGNIDGLGGVALTLVFACVFMVASMLPFFMFMRRREYGRTIFLEPEVQPGEAEFTDYIITIEVPKKLRNTIYIEGRGSVVNLKSRSDATFNRLYPLPHGFEVEDYRHEFDGDYLVLRLKLKRIV